MSSSSRSIFNEAESCRMEPVQTSSTLNRCDKMIECSLMKEEDGCEGKCERHGYRQQQGTCVVVATLFVETRQVFTIRHIYAQLSRTSFH